MKLVENKVEYMKPSEVDSGFLIDIEKCARTCYKSEAKCDGTLEGAADFCAKLERSKHTAMLEHGTIYLQREFTNEDVEFCNMTYDEYWRHIEYWIRDMMRNPYTKVNREYFGTITGSFRECFYITTNWRVLSDNDWKGVVNNWECKPTENHEKRYTFKFICSRGVANELVRHRHFSFAQESTRYCNYSKDQFNNELTFIRPQWANLNSGPYKIEVDTENDVWNIEGDGYYDGCADTPEEELLMHYMGCEQKYLDLLAKGLKPQDAREVLPLGLKTEIVMTGFASDWKDLLDKRLYEKTGKVVPDMLDLMKKLKKVMDDNGIQL